MEGDAFGFKLGHATINDMLFHFEIGNAVAQQATGFRVFFKQMHIMACAGELLGASKACGPRADNRDALAGFLFGNLRGNPAFGPTAFDDCMFNRLDRHGAFDEVQRAGGLARGGADAAGELREVVGRMQVAAGFSPVVVINEIVPVGDLVVDGAAVVAIRNAAIHAAGRLIAQGFFPERYDEFLVVADTVGRRQVLAILTVDFQEAGCLSHCFTLLPLLLRAQHCLAPLPFPSEHGDIQPASPCGISAASCPSWSICVWHARNLCNGHGSR